MKLQDRQMHRDRKQTGGGQRLGETELQGTLLSMGFLSGVTEMF